MVSYNHWKPKNIAIVQFDYVRPPIHPLVWWRMAKCENIAIYQNQAIFDHAMRLDRVAISSKE